MASRWFPRLVALEITAAVVLKLGIDIGQTTVAK
jgi:hypothetical protein